jgi:hypothetical protein
LGWYLKVYYIHLETWTVTGSDCHGMALRRQYMGGYLRAVLIARLIYCSQLFAFFQVGQVCKVYSIGA